MPSSAGKRRRRKSAVRRAVDLAVDYPAVTVAGLIGASALGTMAVAGKLRRDRQRAVEAAKSAMPPPTMNPVFKGPTRARKAPKLPKRERNPVDQLMMMLPFMVGMATKGDPAPPHDAPPARPAPPVPEVGPKAWHQWS